MVQAVISEFGIRGQRGRRLTFIMQEVPDVLVKREKGNEEKFHSNFIQILFIRLFLDAFLQGAADLCGSDIFSEVSSKDIKQFI